jgi:hypothetical protein
MQVLTFFSRLSFSLRPSYNVNGKMAQVNLPRLMVILTSGRHMHQGKLVRIIRKDLQSYGLGLIS